MRLIEFVTEFAGIVRAILFVTEAVSIFFCEHMKFETEIVCIISMTVTELVTEVVDIVCEGYFVCDRGCHHFFFPVSI